MRFSFDFSQEVEDERLLNVLTSKLSAASMSIARQLPHEKSSRCRCPFEVLCKIIGGLPVQRHTQTSSSPYPFSSTGGEGEQEHQMKKSSPLLFDARRRGRGMRSWFIKSFAFSGKSLSRVSDGYANEKENRFPLSASFPPRVRIVRFNSVAVKSASHHPIGCVSLKL